MSRPQHSTCSPTSRSLLIGAVRLTGLAVVSGLLAWGSVQAQGTTAARSAATAVPRGVHFPHPALEAHLAARPERRAILAAPRVMPSADALFDWAERNYPQVFPSHRSTQTAAPYTFRYYPETGNHLGLNGETVVVLGPVSGQQILTVGTRADFACHVSPVSCGAGVSRIAAGVGYSMAARADGSVLQWGELAHTTAGTHVPGTTAIKLDRLSNIVGVKASQASAAVDANGGVHSWGDNYYGALGHSPQGIADTFRQPVPNALIGSVKDAVIDGSAYGMMTIFVRPDGSVGYTPKTFDFGTVAAGTVGSLSGVESLTLGNGYTGVRGHAVRADGTVWSLNWKDVFVSGAWQPQLVAEQVRGLAGIAQLSCTYRYCLAASRDGAVWGWGDGSHGALGDGTGFTRDVPVRALGLANVEKVVAGNFASYAIARDGGLHIWGAHGGGAVTQDYYRSHENDFKRPQLFIEPRFGVVDLATSGSHVILLLKDGTVWGWGDNSHGQVGDGTKDTHEGRISRVLGINLN